MKDKSVSFRLPQNLEQELVALASSTGRTKSFLACQAISEFVAREAWQVKETALAVQEGDAGDFASPEDIQAMDKKWSYKRED